MSFGLNRPKILVVATGGTIASKYDSNTGYIPRVSGSDLLSVSPEIINIAELEVIQPFNVPSFALEPEKLIEIFINIKRRLKDDGGILGAVFIQGTATIEETSYLADLIWDSDKPIVFTGAMLNASEKDSDGARNIYNSVLTAIDHESKDKGALVCIAGEIHAARDVSKIHKSAIQAFASPNTGSLGIVIDREYVVYHRSPTRRISFDITSLDSRVDIIKVALGCDARLLDASVSSGAKGIVLECFPGGGGVTLPVMDGVKKYRTNGVIFVMTPRSPLGISSLKAGGGCGPFDLKQLGVISGGDLTSVKARLLLMAMQAADLNEIEIREMFAKTA
jgi:L-asparaginase